jgi:hypothetical protein
MAFDDANYFVEITFPAEVMRDFSTANCKMTKNPDPFAEYTIHGTTIFSPVYKIKFYLTQELNNIGFYDFSLIDSTTGRTLFDLFA